MLTGTAREQYELKPKTYAISWLILDGCSFIIFPEPQRYAKHYRLLFFNRAIAEPKTAIWLGTESINGCSSFVSF